MPFTLYHHSTPAERVLLDMADEWLAESWVTLRLGAVDYSRLSFAQLRVAEVFRDTADELYGKLCIRAYRASH